MLDKAIIAQKISELKIIGSLFLQKATKLEEELGLFQDSTPPKRGGLSDDEKFKILHKRLTNKTK